MTRTIEAKLEIFESDGYLCASGIGAGIYTWAGTWNKLMKNIRDAVELYYDLPPETEYKLLLETKVKARKSPHRDTVKMVEKFIVKNSGEYKKKAMWKNLPNKLTYRAFSDTIDYLLFSGKIVMDRKGHIIWIWGPKLVKKYLSREDLAIK